MCRYHRDPQLQAGKNYLLLYNFKQNNVNVENSMSISSSDFFLFRVQIKRMKTALDLISSLPEQVFVWIIAQNYFNQMSTTIFNF